MLVVSFGGWGARTVPTSIIMYGGSWEQRISNEHSSNLARASCAAWRLDGRRGSREEGKPHEVLPGDVREVRRPTPRRRGRDRSPGRRGPAEQCSHSVARLARYVEGLQAGLMLPTDHSKVVNETETTALIDGGRSLGQVVGVKGMDLAIEKAKMHGTSFVTARNSNHYGIAGYYALRAVEHGCIGISMTNAAPLVVPTFGRDAILGTNPIAIPCAGEPFLGA